MKTRSAAIAALGSLILTFASVRSQEAPPIPRQPPVDRREIDVREIREKPEREPSGRGQEAGERPRGDRPERGRRGERGPDDRNRGIQDLGPGMGPRPGPGAGPDQRHQHLREAVEHLRAAGLPDMAEGVAHEGLARLGARPDPSAERFEQLQRQLDELREAVEHLHRKVKRLSKEQK